MTLQEATATQLFSMQHVEQDNSMVKDKGVDVDNPEDKVDLVEGLQEQDEKLMMQ